MLLAALIIIIIIIIIIRARARTHTVSGEGPIGSVRVLSFFLLSSFRQNKCLFDPLNVLENSPFFARMSHLAKNLIFRCLHEWAWPNGSVAPPTRF